ncbi:MAG: rane bound O-acyl transferase family protein [Ilumatobacteraceae bacterium]|nr:rane bound O-acyl transferase family protein [Ilumatobacteraceae bacterium]
MVFNSYAFAIFLPIVLGGYWMLRGHRRQNALLLLASYVFYGAWDVRFLLLMWFTTGVDYFVGRKLQRETDDGIRKWVLIVSLVVNLGVLATFKYFGFFTDSFAVLADSVGLNIDPPTLRLLLPIGISFYTFHGISYTVDVYRRHIDAVDDLPTFAVFVSYFPQLVAGPIGRASVQLPQFKNDRVPPDGDGLRSAVWLVLMGLVKKIVIADSLAPLVDQTWMNLEHQSFLSLVLAAIGFSLQIYGDFSGYTDIARGVSRLFGIELLRNFDQPYLSRSIGEFWRRWHISLSTWLRDYLYVPLGGNRRGANRTSFNLFATMLLGGLWHGAAWTFVVWGALHGAMLLVSNRRARPIRTGLRSIPSVIATFGLVTFAWIFFRADSLDAAVTFIEGIVTLQGGIIQWSLLGTLLLVGPLLFAIDVVQRLKGDDAFLASLPSPLQGITAAASVLLLVVFSGGAGAPFIYFQF